MPNTTSSHSSTTVPITQAVPQVASPPRMRTRGQLGIVKPRKIFTLYASSTSRIFTTHQKALSDRNWKPLMTEEYDAQVINKTWRLVSRPIDANVINSLWLYKLNMMQMGIRQGTNQGWWQME